MTKEKMDDIVIIIRNVRKKEKSIHCYFNNHEGKKGGCNILGCQCSCHRKKDRTGFVD